MHAREMAAFLLAFAVWEAAMATPPTFQMLAMDRACPIESAPNGTRLFQIVATSPAACAAACANVTGCTHFSYTDFLECDGCTNAMSEPSQSSTFYGLDLPPSPATNFELVTPGHACPFPEVQHGGTRLFTVLDIETLEGCFALCESTAGCTHFGYRPNKTCDGCTTSAS